MINIDVNFSGDVEAALDKWGKDIQGKVVLAGVAAAAKVIYQEVKANAHRRTISGIPREKGRAPGTLENAVYRVFAKDKSTAETKVYHVSVNKRKAPHWSLIEFGTSRAPAYPYLRPAFDHMKEAVAAGERRMAQKMKEIGST